jgi:hypothetical protein
MRNAMKEKCQNDELLYTNVGRWMMTRRCAVNGVVMCVGTRAMLRMVN